MAGRIAPTKTHFCQTSAQLQDWGSTTCITPRRILVRAADTSVTVKDTHVLAYDGSSAARRYPGYGLEAGSSYDVIVAPQKPSESYVFVRRDGTLFFAVAYSWSDGTLNYVTQEGLRRSVGRDALDLDATQQFNEQRGLNFHSPA